MWGLGLRRREVRALGWKDVDFERVNVNIKRIIVKIGTEIIFKDPTTEMSNIEIELPSTLLRLLQSEKKRYLSKKLRLGDKYEDSKLIVCGDDSSLINPEV